MASHLLAQDSSSLDELDCAGTLEALAANRTIRAAQRRVQAQGYAVREARSNYLPQLDIRSNASRVNEELAIFREEAEPFC